ncbi:MAG TPA: protease pro-enzyme activation domain-containing protein [Bryobacteraceae bacterium]|nr:protease pro-enzyme activation domain-containing protein [Bryobacteraceae bacterium]
MKSPNSAIYPLLILLTSAALVAAPPNRITRAVDQGRVKVIAGGRHSAAEPRFDKGAVDAKLQMDYVVMMLKPSATQQADLDALLTEQQNPSSPNYRKWLSPEEFGNRFGLSSDDHSKVVAWLQSEGLTVKTSARGRNWVAFSGTAGQVGKSLHTTIHRFESNGEQHISNVTDPAVPEALADVVGGFLGLDDFPMNSMAKMVGPVSENTIGTAHYLAPADYGTIYNINPLYQQGLDGTGQSIVVVGQSEVSLTDLRAFRTRYNLPANDPKMLLYNGISPGFNGAQLEGHLDLEWAGAIAPRATLYYVYGANAFTATVTAINLNIAPIISISYGTCEINASQAFYRSIAQQANAQGITLLSASGDSGAGGCDAQGVLPFAEKGQSVDFPAVMPEVTAVGGTQFAEGSGSYWASTNSANGGSALSYIPEAAWNESGSIGLLSSGGGTSRLYPRPAWQTGPGVPADSSRHVPDVSLSAAGHDAYLVTYNGGLAAVSGTSASAPSLAGILALLNHFQVANKFQKQAGLGNINPELYRIAQTQPAVFHDIIDGSNIVGCGQGSPDCTTGTFGYAAGPGYDMATGLGSVDATALVSQWNASLNDAVVTLSTNATRVTVNDTLQVTVTVAPATGTAVPTGTVSISANGVALGSSGLTGSGGKLVASFTVPAYRLGPGTSILAAQYSGDSAFSGAGAEATISVTAPTGAAGITISGASVVWPQPADAQGISWQTTVSLREIAGVPALITGFSMDGQTQSLAQYVPAPNLTANGSINVVLGFRNLAAPVTKTFAFTGVDANGNAWSRQIAVPFVTMPTYNFFSLSATPLTVFQNTAADPSCQWAVQLNVDDLGGNLSLISNLFAGGLVLSGQIPAIFGTTRLNALSGVQGTLCFGGITTPASDSITVVLSNGNSQDVTVSFAGPVQNPGKLSASPAAVTISPTGQTGQATLAVTTSSATQAWTASVFPANRTTAWLSVSQLAGAGTTQLTLKANGAGYEPGVYQATVVLQSDSAVPQVVNVPVMFVLGGSGNISISSFGNSFSGKNSVSPGMLLSVFGANLSNSVQTGTTNPLPYSLGGVSATINGIAAPLLYVSPGQVNLQVPLEAGSGPGVLGINNNGSIAGMPILITPSAPGVATDASHNVVPAATVQPGAYGTLYLTGLGDVTPALKTAYAPATSTPVANLPKPLLSVTVTVGGVPAIVQFAGLIPGAVGVGQINFQVPTTVPPGVQPVVVTVGGVPAPAANITVPGGTTVTTLN